MAETRRFGAPLLEAGQAQKHVTLNEALTRFDAMAAGVVRSRSAAGPASDAADGDVFVVPHGSGGDWVGRDALLALRDNGGWIFCDPVVGRRLWVEDESREIVFDGTRWVVLGASTRHGAATRLEVIVSDHTVSPGAVSVTDPVIPDKAVVLGVTGRVLTSLTGPGLTGWSIGAPGSAGRYGGGYGLSVGSFAQGVTGQPVAYFEATPLVVSAEGGNFAEGVIRLAAHCLLLEPPDAL